MVAMEVTGIDTDLFHYWSDEEGGFSREMDVRNQGSSDSLGAECLVYVADMLYVRWSGNRDAYQLGTCLGEPPALCDGSFFVICVSIAHRLDDNGIAASDLYSTHVNY